MVPHLFYVFAMIAGKALVGRNSDAYLKGKLAVLREVKEICQQRKKCRKLAHQANSPVQFPFEIDPWMPAKLVFRRLKESLRPGSGSSRNHSATALRDCLKLLADETRFYEAA